MSDTDLEDLIAKFWSAFLGHKDAIDKIDLTQQFEAPYSELVKINAAVLICLCGKDHPCSWSKCLAEPRFHLPRESMNPSRNGKSKRL